MYQQCPKCCIDSTAAEFQLTNTGCNFCDSARIALSEVKAEKHKLSNFITKIKEDGEGKKYDCLIGLSGGVDSSYTLYKAVQLGLRPLCFSVDTGYNKPEADENIMRLVEGLKVPFYRYTIDLDKFKELQSAFLMAGVKNVEIPTDHVLMAVTYELAALYDIKWVLSGGNVATESIMPASWGANARDAVHIRDIYKKIWGKKLTGLPICGLLKWNYYTWIKGIKIFYLLDYLPELYNRRQAEQELVEQIGFKPTGAKHEENYFTQWFQNWYLFEKWGIDKRKAHLSSLVVAGQMTRGEALVELEKNPVYPTLGIEQRVMKYPKHEHTAYAQDKWYDRIAKVIKICKSTLTSLRA